MTTNSIYISVVIPCFNEERNIRLGALETVAHFLEKESFRYEVLIVDDGSFDESRKLIKEFLSDHKHFKLLSNKHQGKAATVLAGMLEASGSYILFTDLDQATPIHQLSTLLPFFAKGYDIVIGSRDTYRRGAPFLRHAMAMGFILLRNIILNLGIRDTQCGFKMFRKGVIQTIIPKLRVFHSRASVHGSTVTAGFDVELLYIAKKLGYKIAEVPVEWHYQETRRVNPLKDSWDGLRDLLRIRFNSLFGRY
ncbi:glycosyltransferase [Candidatus Gottesmanbacteria bacterium]|nr:glycosyltransferase [Candidatus Gottesmanbacteria bacterium]